CTTGRQPNRPRARRGEPPIGAPPPALPTTTMPGDEASPPILRTRPHLLTLTAADYEPSSTTAAAWGSPATAAASGSSACPSPAGSSGSGGDSASVAMSGETHHARGSGSIST